MLIAYVEELVACDDPGGGRRVMPTLSGSQERFKPYAAWNSFTR
jgi:hypothetical protein